MYNNLTMNAPNSQSGKKLGVKIIACIEGEDGVVASKEICLDAAIPNINDFDLATKEGFLQNFSEFENAIISARDEVTRGLAEEYLNVASKKTRNQCESRSLQ